MTIAWPTIPPAPLPQIPPPGELVGQNLLELPNLLTKEGWSEHMARNPSPALAEDPRAGQDFDWNSNPEGNGYAAPADAKPSGHPLPVVVHTASWTMDEWAALGPRQQRIVTLLVPEYQQKLERDTAHYGPESHTEFGPKGQVIDLSRKIRVLKRLLWDGVEAKRETPREIVLDLIGHSFLLLELLDSEATSGDEG